MISSVQRKRPPAVPHLCESCQPGPWSSRYRAL